MFEHRTEPLLPKRQFKQRIQGHAIFSLLLLLSSLLLGVFGFHWLAEQAWDDALLNSAMLLGGMGLVGEIHNLAGKLFATFFALFAGIVFLASFTILLVPVFHRFLHKFHLEEQHRKNG
ncbi:MAG: hypothetical protein HY960_05390 [Ignavibacteriae bacterium]|nr:hypothetical protein [Ignavibacteriota bacterium]